jgi:serine protease
VLDDALTYTDDPLGPAPEEAQEGTDGSDGPGSDPGAGDDSDDSAGSQEPVVQSGPNGERLVRTAKFAGLGAIFDLDCSTSCSGMAI